jgi:hypothetical protein
VLHARALHRHHIGGGYAELAVADARFCFAVPEACRRREVAPLVRAGLIGHQALRMAGADARQIGLYGFGAVAHVTAQVARHEGRMVYAITRPGDASITGNSSPRVGAARSGRADFDTDFGPPHGDRRGYGALQAVKVGLNQQPPPPRRRGPCTDHGSPMPPP